MLTPCMQKSVKIIEILRLNNHKKCECRCCNGQRRTLSTDLRACIKTRWFLSFPVLLCSRHGAKSLKIVENNRWGRVMCRRSGPPQGGPIRSVSHIKGRKSTCFPAGRDIPSRLFLNWLAAVWSRFAAPPRARLADPLVVPRRCLPLLRRLRVDLLMHARNPQPI